MSPEELAEILEDAHVVHAAKVVADAAVTASATANAASTTALAAWQARVNSGADDTTLTNYLVAYVDAEVASRLAIAAQSAASTPYTAAGDAMLAAVNAVIAGSMPPPP